MQRTMLEIVNQLDGFDERGKIRVIAATNRPDTLDPALTRPGRLDRHVEVGLPDLDGRANIFRIHTKTMAGESCIHSLALQLCLLPPVSVASSFSDPVPPPPLKRNSREGHSVRDAGSPMP